jgi:TrmH family RNA methyltransferase
VEGAYVVEGPTLVLEAIDAGVAIESAYVDADANSDAVAAVADRLDRAGVGVYDVAGGVLDKLGGAVTPQGIAAVAALGTVTLDAALAEAGATAAAAAAPVVVLAGVADPGNAGTLLRTAEAAGAGAVVFAGPSVDPFAPKVVRSSAGSVFRLPIVVEADAASVLTRVASAGRRLIGLATDAGTVWHEADVAGPLALVLGNESHGVPEPLANAIDEWVRIPMAGRVESLNVATAGAVVLFEAARQRDQSTGRPRTETAGWAPDD